MPSKILITIILFLISFSFLLPLPTLAVAGNPCNIGGYDNGTFHIVPPPSKCIDPPGAVDNCTVCEHSFCDMFVMVQHVLTFLMQIMLAPIVLAAIILAGALYLLGSMRPDWLSLAKKIWQSALIGFVIILCAWLIINTVVNNILHWNQGDSWFNIMCSSEGGLQKCSTDPNNNPNNLPICAEE